MRMVIRHVQDDDDDKYGFLGRRVRFHASALAGHDLLQNAREAFSATDRCCSSAVATPDATTCKRDEVPKTLLPQTSEITEIEMMMMIIMMIMRMMLLIMITVVVVVVDRKR